MREVSFVRANLFEANLLGANTDGADFHEANVTGTKSIDPTILAMAKVQALEKYKLLPHVIGPHIFQGNSFPSDLINKIGSDLVW